MSAYPVCLLCLCTLFPNPQEARGRRGRIKEGEKELRSENVEKTWRETLLRGRREAQTERGGGAVFSHHYCSQSVLAPWVNTPRQKKSDVLLHENIFLEYDRVTHSNSAWPTNYKHNLNDFHCLKTLQKLVFARWKLSLCFWLLFHILPLIFHTQTHQKHFSFF